VTTPTLQERFAEYHSHKPGVHARLCALAAAPMPRGNARLGLTSCSVP
jgi:hypothetical protein